MSSFEFVEKVMCIGGNGTEVPTLQFYKKGFNIGGSVTPEWRDIILSGNTALTLVNAKAESLEYLKLFGGTEQRNLPSGYTQVESITFDGSSYIDTGIKANSAYTYKFKVKRTSPYNSNIWGVKTNSSYSANSSIILGWTGISYIGIYSHEGADEGGNPQVISWGTGYHTIEFNPTSKKLIIDGVDRWSTLECGCLTNENWSSNTYNLYLGGTNTVGSFVGGGVSTWTEYEVWNGEVLLQRLVSCKNSSNVIGMYDTVSDTFLTNAGTGSFTAGADVTTPSPDYPMDIVCNNGVVKVNRNLYWTEYYGYQLSQVDGVTTSVNNAVNVSGMVDCRNIKSFKITTISSLGSFRIFKYKADNTFINANSTANMGDIVTVEDNVGFFRIQYNFSTSGTGTQNILIYNSAYNLNEIYTDGTTETVQITGKNLFTGQADITQGYYLNDNGVATPANGLAYTNGYTIVNGGTYTFSGYDYALEQRGNFSAVCYDENKNVLGRVGRMEFSYNYSTFTTLPNTKYLRFNIPVNTTSTSPLQLELGSVATSYMPYEIYTDGTTETVQITGKNLFDYEYFYDNYQTYDVSAVGRCPIKLNPNTTYTISTNRNSSENKSVIFVVSGSAIDWAPVTANNGVTSNSPRTVTTDSNGYLCLGIYVSGNNEVPESEFISGTTWVQLELGSTATTYEEYFNGGQATAENLFKVGDYQDVQSVIDGGVTRKVGVKVLDGSEDWSLSGTSFRFDGNVSFVQPNTCLCTHFEGWLSSDSITAMPDLSIKAGHPTNTYRVYVRYDNFTTVEQLKSWLANQYENGTPVIIVYPLATATTETVTAQPMNIQAGTNIVQITQASMDDLELEVKYKAGVSVTITEIQNAQLDENVEVTIN